MKYNKVKVSTQEHLPPPPPPPGIKGSFFFKEVTMVGSLYIFEHLKVIFIFKRLESQVRCGFKFWVIKVSMEKKNVISDPEGSYIHRGTSYNTLPQSKY